MPPGVLRIPLRERIDFILHISLRYAKQIATYWPTAMAYARRNPYPHLATDDELCSLLYDTSMAKLLSLTLDPADRASFAEILAEHPNARYAKSDFSAYAELRLRPGMYAAPTVALFKFDENGRPRLLAIKVHDLVLRPGDGGSWDLAKMFVLQGAGHHMVNCHHIPLHFPLDAINAISKSVLPRGHVLSRLLEPHFRFSLSLNEAALYSGFSILRNREELIYSTFAFEQDAIYRLTRIGYAGLPGNSAYPVWRYSPVPEPVMGDFGVFLDRYYEAMLEFTTAVAAAVPKDDPHVREWADTIAEWLPGFPDAAAIREGDLLARVLAKTIWSATVAHAADHYDYGRIPIGKIPLRLRVPPPTQRGVPLPPPETLGRWTDAMRHDMARVLFFKEDTITPLIDVRYNFGNAALDASAAAFVRRLHDVDASLDVRRFIPLEQIPASIQF